MRVPGRFSDCVVYLVADGEQDESGCIVRKPFGSAFGVVVRSDKHPDYGLPYFVTARHCIEDVPSNKPVYIRLGRQRIKSGILLDVPTSRDNWRISDTHDVAILCPNWVTPVPNQFSQMVNFPFIEASEFVDTDYGITISPVPVSQGGIRLGVGCGDDVFMPGLLTQSPGEENVLPVTRYGKIARMPSEPMLLTRHGGAEEYKALAYLVEAQSWPGQSGSPVFWTQPYQRSAVNPFRGGPDIWVTEYATGLLGVLSTYCVAQEEIADNQAMRTGEHVKANTGIAVVTPVQALHDLLFSADIVRDREAGTDRQAADHARRDAPRS